MASMKIAILQPYIEGIGGAQRVIETYALYLQKRGHEVEIFTQRYNSKTAYPGFKKLKINLLGLKSKIFSPFVFWFKKFDGFDVVIANDWPTNFASLRNDNVFWVCYSPKRDFYDLRKYYWNNAGFLGKVSLVLKRILFQGLDKLSAQNMKTIATNSINVRERVKKYYGRDAEVVYHGINYNDYKSKSYQNYILSVGRFVPAKRVDMAIKSMGFVKNKQLGLYVVGDGPDKDKIIELCKNYPNVKFLGNVSDDELIRLYANCLGVISICINEDWGLVPLEAGASRKVIIGENEGGLRESVINGQTGFLLDGVRPESIAETIDFLADNKKLAIKMGKEARKNVKRFDWKILLPKLEKLIKDISVNGK
jgi:glycosyltransferase involved in cell wall biosynthesis